MKNKYFVISVVLVFLINALMLVTGSLPLFSFSYFLKSSMMLSIAFLVILDALTIYTVIQLMEITSKWIKRKESFNDPNIKISSRILLISILITLGFNIMGIIYFFVSRIYLNELMIAITFNAFVLLYIIYLIFRILLHYTSTKHILRL